MLILSVACSAPESSEVSEENAAEEVKIEFAYYGDTIDPNGSMAMTEVVNLVDQTGEATAKIEGTITSCCQKKGCWMVMDVAGYENEIRVTFKDYGFFVPLNSAENWAVVEGKAYLDTVSVETLRHYAEDEGKSEEEIMEITEPEISLAFEASGVAIKDMKGAE